MWIKIGEIGREKILIYKLKYWKKRKQEENV